MTSVSNFFEGKEQEKIDIFRKVHLNEGFFNLFSAESLVVFEI